MSLNDPRTWRLRDYAIAIVMFAAVCALVYVACSAMGIVIPVWAVHALWIVIVAFVVIVLIRLVTSF
jgi:hypothetical protein